MTQTQASMSDQHELVGTRIPRWTAAARTPQRGSGRLTVPVPAELAGVLRRLGAEHARATLLAAHLKVLSELSAERFVLTAVRSTAGTAARRCHLTLTDGTWRELVADAAQADARAHPPTPGVADTGEPAAEVETLLDLAGLDTASLDTAGQGSGGSAAVPAGVGLALVTSYTGSGDDMRLRLVFRHDVATADFAERIAGYHLAALRLIITDPDAPHLAASLVSAAELHTHLHELAGPRVPLTGGLFVELFEEQVRRRPDAPAAIHGERHWSYRELNEHANQIANRLLRDGLGGEQVVAVVMERNLDWLAAMLGVFKAGGAYLPVRPDFPPDRIAAQLDRSDCRFAVTEPGSERTLHEALDRSSSAATRACRWVRVAQAYRDTAATTDPGVAIAPGQLAYIYFTSGSTGEPKGAMCEHLGMINHLYTKIDDLKLRAGEVVTQTASQCFDISLWQLASPLLVGGCTAIIDTERQLDVERFIGQLAAGGVDVIQIVPAYLDVMLSHLERHPQPLGDLRTVSVTGEALRLGLVQRWFALHPGITLVNAYGATEVSDDTMHAVLDRVPDRDLSIVSVGRSLRNIDTYVLNDRMRVAPLGAPGEIAFAGVCVGRGYVNDPERTAQAFVEDPYRPGVRLYRTGDFGRWLPEGTIEFLGRRDEQVKIRGFRIELGEIENRLLQMPGVRKTAVVIDGASDQTKNLVAFFTGSSSLEPADLRDFLAGSLPDYMVPSYFHRLDAIPLTDNGKTNKKLLTGLASELGRDVAAYASPVTETERRLATAWAEILNVLIGRISRADDFFRLGGTSLAAVRLVVKLDRLVSLRQLVAHPVLSDLAAVIDAGRDNGPTGPEGPSLLQRLSAPQAAPVASLVCFPYAGGNSVNFQLLAKELEPARITVYGVELPGHDVAQPDEPLADVPEIARRAHAEIRASVSGPVLLWGQCAGGAPALETARLLERDGQPADRLLIGAFMLDEPERLLAESNQVSALTNQEITAQLHGDSVYIELDLMKSERSELVGAAYRHDVCSTNQHLIALQHAAAQHATEQHATEQHAAPERLHTPVDVIAAADDPTTQGHRDRYRRWELVAETVRLHELDEGGHYFSRTRAAAVAELVAAAALATVPPR